MQDRTQVRSVPWLLPLQSDVLHDVSPSRQAGRDWRVAQRFEDKWHEGVLNPMRYGTLRVWWSLHYEVHYEDGHTCKHPMVAADYGQGMADNWVIIQKKIR